MPTIIETLLDAFESAPCDGCKASEDRRVKRVYPDPETGRRFCLPCLEAAVDLAQEEARAERQEMARLACWGRQIAA